jgi:signal transduction histidine kinase
MRLFASDMLSARDIRFRFEAHGADLRLGADLRREVYLIFKECVNNLAKHSGSTEADIELRSEGGWLTVRINDNGRGFDPAQATDGGQSRGGHGLGGMRRRAEALGGTFAVESAPGRGTTVRLHVPVRASRRAARRKAAT